MKEEWKVYIKGVPGRGDEVIKVLTNLGAENKYLYDGEGSDRLYFIRHEGVIEWIHSDDEMAKIIMDNYRELHLLEQWKDGDILINNDGSDYKVFWEYDSDSDTSFYAYNVSMDVNGTLTQYSGSIWHGEKMVCFIEDYRLATHLEVKRFHELLNKCGKDWDAEKKQLVDLRWKPKKGDSYFYINHYIEVVVTTWMCDYDDQSHYNAGNCFRTREEAEAMAEKIKKLLNAES